jgi:hypothetical protein
MRISERVLAADLNDTREPRVWSALPLSQNGSAEIERAV